jgi:ectoine hydroxylase-related dioxygenase (phytanoyl-CoA dioxygenase family)
MEDIHRDSGPLVYYPGSHRLPYLTSVDIGVPVSAGAARTNYDAEYHAKYEPAIARLIAEHDFKPAYFTPSAGDALLWHANLLHGGSPRNAVQHTRKALVCHYFAQGCLTYHDLSTRPSYVLGAAMERPSS